NTDEHPRLQACPRRPSPCKERADKAPRSVSCRTPAARERPCRRLPGPKSPLRPALKDPPRPWRPAAALEVDRNIRPTGSVAPRPRLAGAAKRTPIGEPFMQFHGIIPPVATPMKDNEDLDIPRLRWFIDHLIGSGVHGIFVLGTNSEFYALDEREKQEV